MAGHCFVVLLRDGYPVNVLNPLKQVPEVCSIFCASANPVQVVVAETDLGRGILGVIDGLAPAGVETDVDVLERRQLLRAPSATSSDRLLGVTVIWEHGGR